MGAKKKQWHFWWGYEIIMFMIILSVVLFVYLQNIIAKTWLRNLNIPFSYTDFQGQFFSFFTIQSNILIGVWFLLAAIFHFKSESQKIFLVKQKGLIAVTVYITVTMIIYMLLILPFAIKEMNQMKWVQNMLLHLAVPVLTIFYFIFNIGKSEINIEIYAKKNLIINLIYPTLYFFYLVLRLAMALLDNRSAEQYFPYFPKFNLEGWVLVIFATISIFFILVVFISINIGYCYLNNYIQKNILKKNKM